ncbi:sensor histidine kinase [Corynebacterium camporealensis]
MEFDKTSAKFALWTRLALEGTVLALTFACVVDVFSSGSLPAVIAGIGLIILAACGIAAIETDPRLHLHPRASAIHWKDITTGMGLVIVVLAWATIEGADAAFPIVISICIVCLTSLHARPWSIWFAIALSIACAVILYPLDRQWMGVLPVLCYATTVYSLWYMDSIRAAERKRQLESLLQIQDERLRFAQQLHDTLGQHLAAMSVKAELAKALVTRGDDRAEQVLSELQELTKISMGQMRDVVEGYRTINLSTELAGARELLESAGITVTIEGNAIEVPQDKRELTAWFVRESATNILKHSQATHATIVVNSTEVTVSNNGAVEAPGRLGGLNPLRQRAEEMQGQLSVDHAGSTYTASLSWPKEDHD